MVSDVNLHPYSAGLLAASIDSHARLAAVGTYHPLERCCPVYPANYPFFGVSISQKTQLAFSKNFWIFRYMYRKMYRIFPKSQLKIIKRTSGG